MDDERDGVTTLRAGDLVVEVDGSAGARVRSLRSRDEELLVTAGRLPFGNHSFVMAPYAGRVRDAVARWDGRELALPRTWPPHAIHGLVHDRPWERTEVPEDRVSPGAAIAAWRIAVPADAWFARLVVAQVVAVTPVAVRLDLEVTAPDAPAPATTGWHPWFRREIGGHQVAIELPDARLLRRDADGIATSERIAVPEGPLDDALVELTGPVHLRWGDHLAVSVASDAPVTTVFTEHPLGVCAEPQSGPPDEVNADPRVVVPGAPLALSTTWTVAHAAS